MRSASHYRLSKTQDDRTPRSKTKPLRLSPLLSPLPLLPLKTFSAFEGGRLPVRVSSSPLCRIIMISTAVHGTVFSSLLNPIQFNRNSCRDFKHLIAKTSIPVTALKF